MYRRYSDQILIKIEKLNRLYCLYRDIVLQNNMTDLHDALRRIRVNEFSNEYPSAIVSMFASCTDLSEEKRTFLQVYLDMYANRHKQFVTEPSRPAFYRMADGTLVSARERNRILPYTVLNYIKTGLTYEQIHFSSTWVYTKYGYVHSTKPPARKSTEQVFAELGPEIRAMYEAVAATRVPVGTPLADILSGKVKCCEMPVFNVPIYSTKGTFHPPPPLSDLFTEKRSVMLRELCSDLGLPDKVFDISTWVNATNTVSTIMHALRLNVDDGRVVNDHVRKKNSVSTKKIVWQHRSTIDREFLPEKLRSRRKYSAAVDLMGTICGRLINMNVAGLKVEAILLDKIGVFGELIKEMPIETLDIDTAIFCSIVASNLRMRKELATQICQDDGIDKFMITWYQELLCRSPTTQWNLVMSLFPTNTAISRCSKDDFRSILEKWMQVATALRVPMQSMWVTTVRDAAMHNMIVPSGFDSTGWNAMANAWNTAHQFIASICAILEIPMPWAITQCLNVTPHSQAEYVYADPDCAVFAKLAEWGRSPWSAIDDPTLTIEKRMEEITQICRFKKIQNAYKAQHIDPILTWRIN
jgi:hypothetical protein